jgi:HipA-like protein
MNKMGSVYINDIPAGTLEYRNDEYVFTYDQQYFNNPAMPAIALSLPKNKIEHHSTTLFSFFYGLLAEGYEKTLQCTTLKIDENDNYARLLKTAARNTIGAVTIREVA